MGSTFGLGLLPGTSLLGEASEIGVKAVHHWPPLKSGLGTTTSGPST